MLLKRLEARPLQSGNGYVVNSTDINEGDRIVLATHAANLPPGRSLMVVEYTGTNMIRVRKRGEVKTRKYYLERFVDDEGSIYVRKGVKSVRADRKCIWKKNQARRIYP